MCLMAAKMLNLLNVARMDKFLTHARKHTRGVTSHQGSCCSKYLQQSSLEACSVFSSEYCLFWCQLTHVFIVLLGFVNVVQLKARVKLSQLLARHLSYCPRVDVSMYSLKSSKCVLPTFFVVVYHDPTLLASNAPILFIF